MIIKRRVYDSVRFPQVFMGWIFWCMHLQCVPDLSSSSWRAWVRARLVKNVQDFQNIAFCVLVMQYPEIGIQDYPCNTHTVESCNCAPPPLCMLALGKTGEGADFLSWNRHSDQPFLHSDNGTVVLNVKDDARFGQKMVSDRSHRYLASDSIDYNDLNCC